MSTNWGWLYSLFPDLSDWQPLSGGAQKDVLFCRHIRFGSCVLKIVKRGREGRLDREIEAVNRLKGLASKNVPQIYEISVLESETGEQLVCLLEQCVKGADLSELLKKGVMTRERLLRLASDLLSVAKDAESVGVVHRDIKPQNIKVEPSGKAWLLDFGIARILDLESRTSTDVLMGPHTPGYGAPEQFRYDKRNIDGRADLFAIGVVLYEAAIGVNPFVVGTRDVQDVLHRTEQTPLPRLKLAWDVDDQFAGFVSTLTQKRPDQRPRSCAEAYDWFQDIVRSMGGI